MSDLEKKIPPQNIEAEQSVLGAILIDSDAIHRVVDIVRPDSFYKEAHKQIYSTMLELTSKGEPIDIITLSEKLRANGLISKVGGASYINDLADVITTSANVEHYSRIIGEKAVLRNLISTGSGIVESAFSTLEATTILDDAEKKIYEIANARIKKGFVHIKDILVDVMDKIEEMYDQDEGILGIPSSYPDLDRLTSGFQPADLIILAARPSMGKTAFVLNLAINIALKEAKNVGIFSLEMSKEALVQRIICSDAELDGNKLKTGNLNDIEWKKLMRTMGRIDGANIFIDDTPGINAMELRAKARRIKVEKGLDLIIIDYLQLMQGSKLKVENRTQEISEIARLLKSIARELSVPVIALSQLSRAIEQRTEKLPRLSDLRESGEIEQTADLVMFIHRDDYYEASQGSTSLTDIIIAKHRNGPTGKAELIFRKDIAKFVNKANEVDA
jgi:replicative DNA helicase